MNLLPLSSGQLPWTAITQLGQYRGLNSLDPHSKNITPVVNASRPACICDLDYSTSHDHRETSIRMQARSFGRLSEIIVDSFC